ncbi:MAG: Mut7-C RNAse domain-containing protein [Candidatus Thorarchaeota archaeon]|nr:MAG: hypothetical protein DRP09_09740 [Candidatus Thorarchaeota archaeon]RLI57568.1 MAG: hypothetical protein DRO87_06825 [Candidatus Thorarchaeota archaeon]
MKTFVVDAMLGRLATWLRLVGCDTFYSTQAQDDELLTIAREQGRVLLTSDAELVQRAERDGIESVLVRGTVDERVASVFSRFGIDPVADPSVSRCTKCNGELTQVSGEDKVRVKGLVFEQTYNHYDRFWICEYCKSVFFEGGQWENIRKYMAHISDMMEDTK